MDANFRLKRRAISNDARDPGLMSGLGYFVEDKMYREHILNYVDQDDVSAPVREYAPAPPTHHPFFLQISTCTGFAAMVQANSKFNRGYAATGCGLVLCSRHGFILPNGVGDLQKGER